MDSNRCNDFIFSVMRGRHHFFDPLGVIYKAELGLKDKEEIGECLMYLGERCLDNMRFDTAQIYFENLVELVSANDQKAKCHFLMGMTNECKEDFESAIKWYEKSLSFKAHFDQHILYSLYNNLAKCLNQVKRYREALTCCQSAIAICRDSSDAQMTLGIALEGLGQYAEAANSYMISLNISPSNREAFRCLQNIIAEYPEVLEVKGMRSRVDSCREAFATRE